MADEATLGSGWLALGAAAVTGLAMSLRTWYSARVKARIADRQESAAVSVARITSDESANRRLIDHLSTENAKLQIDNGEVVQERDRLQERNMRLARMLALTTAHNNILTRELLIHNLSIPMLPNIDDGPSCS